EARAAPVGVGVAGVPGVLVVRHRHTSVQGLLLSDFDRTDSYLPEAPAVPTESFFPPPNSSAPGRVVREVSGAVAARTAYHSLSRLRVSPSVASTQSAPVTPGWF